MSLTFQQALRQVLQQPLLVEGMEQFKETHAWRHALTTWFAEQCAWTLQSGPGVLRLVAAPEVPEGGRAFDGLKNPMACAMFVWILWFHEYLGLRVGEVRQFSLAELSEVLESQASLDFSELSLRRALIQAIREHTRMGTLILLDQETDAWVTDTSQAGALLEFSLAATYLISSSPQAAPSPEQRARRALLVGPALLKSQDPEAYAAFTPALQEELEETLGWAMESHPTYMCLLRNWVTHGNAERLNPGRSALEAAALMLLEQLRTEVLEGRLTPNLHQELHVSRMRLYVLMDQVREKHKHLWGEWGKNNTHKMLAEILQLWTQWGGCQAEAHVVVLQPHLGRFEASYSSYNTPILKNPEDPHDTL